MNLFDGFNRALARRLIRDFAALESREVRLRCGLAAGWVIIAANSGLFVVRLVLGLMAGSVSVVADAFHLLSHLANAIVLVVSFWLAGRPATARTPFGHGRMEHVAPLIMAVLLAVAGLQLGEQAFHRVLHPGHVNYWPALPWLLLATILVKIWVGGFSRYLSRRSDSRAIAATAAHQYIEAGVTLAVIAGLVAGHHFHRPVLDGYLGLGVSAWLLWAGINHARHALVPILGGRPDPRLIERIRELAGSVEGVEDVHEIIVHDYGSKYLISFHAEIPEGLGPAAMHEIAEICEARLRQVFGGEVVVHTDPLVEQTPEVRALERRFRKVVETLPWVVGFHDFRVVAASENEYVLVADVDLSEDIPEAEFENRAGELERLAKEALPNLAYATLYITPKFSY